MPLLAPEDNVGMFTAGGRRWRRTVFSLQGRDSLKQEHPGLEAVLGASRADCFLVHCAARALHHCLQCKVQVYCCSRLGHQLCQCYRNQLTVAHHLQVPAGILLNTSQGPEPLYRRLRDSCIVLAAGGIDISCCNATDPRACRHAAQPRACCFASRV